VSQSRLPIAVFLSGGGRTLGNLIEHRDDGTLPVDIRLVISSSSKVKGVSVARDAGIETSVIRKTDHLDPNAYCHAMFDPCRSAGVDLVVMAGFLKHVLIPEDFVNKVVNIHPSLLPKYGGPGMYGHHVHQAAIEAGETTSGCTVHYVDNQYDNGPIILQRSCEVKQDDTADALAARVFAEECQALPEALRNIASSSAAGRRERPA